MSPAFSALTTTRQVAWPGRLDDLLEAAQTAPIDQISLPVGTRMRFIASRAQGKPVALRDVLWAGQALLTGLRLTCTLPEAQQLVSASGATAGAAEGRTVTTELLPTLSPKAEAVWRVEGLATAAGDVRFHALLRCDQFDRPIEETEATREY
jgi:hypothetical protein